MRQIESRNEKKSIWVRGMKKSREDNQVMTYQSVHVKGQKDRKKVKNFQKVYMYIQKIEKKVKNLKYINTEAIN